MLRSPLALILLIVASCSDGRTEGPAIFVASIVEEYDHVGYFHGFSGIELGPDGSDVALLTDSGNMILGQLHRDAEGRPTGLRRWRFVSIEEPDDALVGPRGLDSEGLAVTDDGLYVSFERMHAVWQVSRDGKVVERLPRPAGFDDLQENSSFEALASDEAGALYVLPERSGGRKRPFPVWRYSEGEWRRAFDLPRRGRFLAVGADFGPDGRLYLLERRVLLPFGFATRVRRFGIEGDSIVSEETLLETRPGAHDNLEGLAVWQDDLGAIRLTMVSDDNFFWLQQTEIVEYRLPLDAGASLR